MPITGIPQNDGKFCWKPMKNQLKTEHSDLPRAHPKEITDYRCRERIWGPTGDLGSLVYAQRKCKESKAKAKNTRDKMLQRWDI